MIALPPAPQPVQTKARVNASKKSHPKKRRSELKPLPPQPPTICQIGADEEESE